MRSMHLPWGCAWDTATSPPRVKKWNTHQKINRIPHPNRSIFLRGVFGTLPDAEPPWLPLPYGGMKKSPQFLVATGVTFLKTHPTKLACTPCVVSEQSNFRGLVPPQYSPRIKYGRCCWALGGNAKCLLGGLNVKAQQSEWLLLMLP